MGTKYFLIQTKRLSRSLPFVIILSAILALSLMLAFAALAEDDAEKNKKLGLAIVGDTSDTYLELGFAALKNFDSSRFAIDVSFMEEGEAESALEKGDISAYIVIPENFIKDAYHGEIGRLKYVSTTGAVAFSTIIKDEILNMISTLLVEAQKGIYASGDVAMEYGEGLKYGKVTNDASLEYFDIILSRSNAYTSENLGFGDGLELFMGIFCGGLIFFLLLSGIGFAPAFSRRDDALSSLLCSGGFSPFSQIISEFSAFLFCSLLSSASIIGAIFILPKNPITALLGIDKADIGFFLSLLLGYVMICAMQFFVFEAVRSIVPSVLSHFFLFTMLAFFTGCLYPISFFPDVIKSISVFLPTGAMRALLSASLSGDDTLLYAALVLLYLLVFVFLSVLLRKNKTVSKRGESI